MQASVRMAEPCHESPPRNRALWRRCVSLQRINFARMVACPWSHDDQIRGSDQSRHGLARISAPTIGSAVVGQLERSLELRSYAGANKAAGPLGWSDPGAVPDRI